MLPGEKRGAERENVCVYIGFRVVLAVLAKTLLEERRGEERRYVAEVVCRWWR